MHLDCIDTEAYYQFAANKFEQHQQQIDRNTFDSIYHRLFGHTWYLQATLNRLYEKGTECIEKNDVEHAFREIVAENEATFQTLLRLITPAQRKLLKAIAKEGEVAEINGKAFLSRNSLGAASTINAAAKSLVDKELLLEQNGKYSVYDRFLSLYLSDETI